MREDHLINHVSFENSLKKENLRNVEKINHWCYRSQKDAIKVLKQGAGERALRLSAVLLKDLGSILSTHVATHNCL